MIDAIEIDFDFRQDSKCGDPDTDSQKLYEAHKLLWSKENDFPLGNSLLHNNLCASYNF